jgi:hypothetical protein
MMRNTTVRELTNVRRKLNRARRARRSEGSPAGDVWTSVFVVIVNEQRLTDSALTGANPHALKYSSCEVAPFPLGSDACFELTYLQLTFCFP